jgi:hypothetical protein
MTRKLRRESEVDTLAKVIKRTAERADVAKAVGKCVSAHKNGFDPLKAIALGRAMGAACTSEQ